MPGLYVEHAYLETFAPEPDQSATTAAIDGINDKGLSRSWNPRSKRQIIRPIGLAELDVLGFHGISPNR
jgi:hypothetical protein